MAAAPEEVADVVAAPEEVAVVVAAPEEVADFVFFAFFAGGLDVPEVGTLEGRESSLLYTFMKEGMRQRIKP